MQTRAAGWMAQTKPFFLLAGPFQHIYYPYALMGQGDRVHKGDGMMQLRSYLLHIKVTFANVNLVFIL